MKSDNNFVVKKAESKPNKRTGTLVLLFGFYNASESAIKKYCSLYHNYGFDVLYVHSVLKHFAWPKNSIELSDKLLNYLDNSCSHYDNLLVHAFSMGAYNFTVSLGTMYSKPEMHKVTQTRIRGVVFDSLAIGNLQSMSRGVAAGLSRNPFVRVIIPLAMSAYFWTTDKHTVKVYDHFLDLIEKKPLQVPTLFFCCKNDRLSEYDVIEAMANSWKRNMTFPVVMKAWKESTHAAHLLTHPEEYSKTLDDFLGRIPEIAKDLKMKSKI